MVEVVAIPDVTRKFPLPLWTVAVFESDGTCMVTIINLEFIKKAPENKFSKHICQTYSVLKGFHSGTLLSYDRTDIFDLLSKSLPNLHWRPHLSLSETHL